MRGTIAFVEACARRWNASDYVQCVAAAMVVPPYVRAALLGRPLDADDLYRAIDIPVLFSHGLHDAIAPVAAARHGHAITPNSTLSIYENAGHAPFMEEPERFNRELAEFVRSGAPGRT
jgi:non-heme chloroperoxidase